MPAKKPFTPLDDKIVSLVQDNIAWGVATRVASHVISAARLAFENGIELVTEDEENLSPYKKGDMIYLSLVQAVNLVDAAELDSIPVEIIQEQMEEQLARQFRLDPRKIYNFMQEAFDSLYITNDDFVLMPIEDQKPLVVERNRRLVIAAKQRDIAIRDAKLEYRDLAESFLGNLINPAGNMVVTGTGDKEEYLESRGKALTARIKALKGKSANVDGEWLNRYDFNGLPVNEEAQQMDGLIILVIDEGVRLGYRMPEYPRDQTQANAAFKVFQSG